jgi:hypothetical protein
MTGATGMMEGYFWFVIVAVSAFILLAFATLRSSLANSQWKLSDALSEAETQPSPAGGAAAAGAAGGGGGAGGALQMSASSSRLIAFIGMITLSALFLGVGYFTLWALFFGQPKDIQAVKDTGALFLTGSALFAPYAFNKLAEVFKK